MTPAITRIGLLAVLAALVACTAQPKAQGDASSSAAPAAQTKDIRHLKPVPDSVGPMPKRFEWTAVEGADSYTFRIWNEVDVRLASESGLTTTFIDAPDDFELPFGTYFWSVLGVRDGQVIAESGLAAFVVKP